MDKARLFPYDEGRKDGMPMEIGAKLRQARIAAGLTQEQTAEGREPPEHIKLGE